MNLSFVARSAVALTHFWIVVVSALAASSCAAPSAREGEGSQMKSEGAASPQSNADDPYLWLEEIDSPRSLQKVGAWNKTTLAELQGSSKHPTVEKELRKIILAKDRIPYGALRNGYLYNFWQDEKSVRGIWRRTPITEYRKATPKWEVILDLDKLAKDENENWVWKGSTCLPPAHEKCLLSLSRGGKDAVVVREFDVVTKKFVEDGFYLPEAKSRIGWFNKDSIFVGSDFGPGSMTKAGYPRQVRLWSRGQKVEGAPKIYEAQEDDISAGGSVAFAPEGNVPYIYRGKTFYTAEILLIRDAKGERLEKLPVPEDFELKMFFGKWVLGMPRTNWTVGAQTFKAGSLVRMDLENLKAAPLVVFEPGERVSIADVDRTKTEILLLVNDNVKSRLYRIDPQSTDWKLVDAGFPKDGVLGVNASDAFDDRAFISYESFLQPSTLYAASFIRGQAAPSTRLKSIPARFDAKGLVMEQFEAVSKDGTSIPYFVVRPKNMRFDGSNPTLLYGYGGFMSSELPFYLSTIGKVWSEKGGVYVLANIRGGGEFGPNWHEAARLENRQRAFDDFIAIGEDLIKRKISSPQHLGIMGGSNGGLLVGAVFTQRPELFNAVVCQVPLLDMLRYHKLLAGHSWMAEYGDPDDPKMRPVIERYSPYQNVRPGVKYPRVLFVTSTRDDRVHPGHARKMAARMEEQGHPFMYYEIIEGGHGAAANLEQRIKRSALEWTYLWQQLGPK